MKPVSAAAALLLAAALPTQAATPGAQTYAAWCQGCHQADGSGVKSVFPALAASSVVTGDPAAPIALVLDGKGAMPPMGGSLSDAEIAGVLTYVRGAFGNHAGPVAAAEVAKVRAAAKPD